jgi:hypothetical protein
MRALLLRVSIGLPLCLAAGVFATAPAHAGDAPASDTQYSIFNPVPDDKMRDFATDRPTKSNVPYTVPAGHFQYEMDMVIFTHQVTGTVRTDTLLIPNAFLKLGVTDNIDLQVQIAPFASVRTADWSTGMSTTVTGTSDLFLRAKINLWGNDGGSSAFALFPYVKVPTAPIGIGNGATEAGLFGLLSFSMPAGFTLLFNSEIDALKDSIGSGYHSNVMNLVNLNKQVIKDVTLYVEFWSNVNNDPLRPTTQFSLDTAVAWAVRKDLQLDVGANFGLNRVTPQLQVYAGVSQRF